MQAQPFLSGKRMYLRGLRREDLPTLASWFDSEEVTRYMMTGTVPSNIDSLADEYERLRRSTSDVVFVIADRTSDRPVGWCGLYDIHPYTRKAEFRILIGDVTCWNRGYGSEATILTVTYAFERLNLNRVWLGVNAENKRAIRAYQKVGFVIEGVLRADHYRNGRYYDNVRMSVLREDFYSAPDQMTRSLTTEHVDAAE